MQRLLLLISSFFIINTQAQSVVEIYPNPTGQYLNTHILIDSNQLVSIHIYNVMGEIVDTFFTNKYLWKGDYLFAKNLFYYKEGAYILKIQFNNIEKTIKFLKYNDPDNTLYFDQKNTIIFEDKNCETAVKYSPATGNSCSLNLTNYTHKNEINYTVSFPNTSAEFTLLIDKQQLPTGTHVATATISNITEKTIQLNALPCTEGKLNHTIFVKTNIANQQLQIVNPLEDLLSYTLIDISGKIIGKGESNLAIIPINDFNKIATAIYLIEIKKTDGFILREKIIY